MQKIFLILLLSVLSLLFQSSAFASTIKVGAIFADTGVASLRGKLYFQAVRHAFDKINENGGIAGRQVELLTFDNGSSPRGAQRAARKAVKAEIIAVIGCAWSSQSKAAATVLQKNGIPMISPISTHPNITRMGDYIFRVCFTDDFQGKVMARFAREELKAQTAVILTNRSSMYSIGLSKEFEASFKKLGGKVLSTYSYTTSRTNFSTIVRSLNQLNPDICYLPDQEVDSVRLLEYFSRQGLNLQFLGGDGWNETMYPVSGNEIRGSYFTVHWHPDVESALSREFVATTRRETQPEEKLFVIWALVQDCVNILQASILEAGSFEPEAIRDAIAATHDFEGVTGRISFDEYGDPVKPAVILRFNNDGKTIDYIKQIHP